MSAGKQIERAPRNVPMPVEYITACKALAACISIDEAKHWSDKADALAAWSRIYQSNEASVQAKRLKLHAYRRMGHLAEALQPSNRPAPRGSGRGGNLPGAKALLRAHGFSESAAQVIRGVSRISDEKFDAAIRRPDPPFASTFSRPILSFCAPRKATGQRALHTGPWARSRAFAACILRRI